MAKLHDNLTADDRAKIAFGAHATRKRNAKGRGLRAVLVIPKAAFKNLKKETAK